MGNGNHWCISKIKSRKKLVVKFKNWKAAIIIYIAFFMTPSIHDFNHLTRQRVGLSLNPSSWLCVEINSRTQHIPERPIWCLLQKKNNHKSKPHQEREVRLNEQTIVTFNRTTNLQSSVDKIPICNNYNKSIPNLLSISSSPLSPLPERVNKHTYTHTKK